MPSNNPNGRPTKYDEDKHLPAIKVMARLGATDEEIAQGLDISVTTLYRWKHRFSEFCEALKRGKAEADQRVENALYHRALGFSHDDIDLRVINGELIKTPIRKHYAPDTTCMIFWLKNRQPDKWRDKPFAGGGSSIEELLGNVLNKFPD